MKPGDIVRLKSGGPRMTIQAILDDRVVCKWFDKNDTEQSGGYNIESLELAPTKDLGMA